VAQGIEHVLCRENLLVGMGYVLANLISVLGGVDLGLIPMKHQHNNT